MHGTLRVKLFACHGSLMTGLYTLVQFMQIWRVGNIESIPLEFESLYVVCHSPWILSVTFGLNLLFYLFFILVIKNE